MYKTSSSFSSVIQEANLSDRPRHSSKDKKPKKGGSACKGPATAAVSVELPAQLRDVYNHIHLVHTQLHQKQFYHFSVNWVVLSKQLHLASDVSQDQLLTNKKP